MSHVGTYETEPTERHEELYLMSETIVGTLDAVTEKGDWTTFEINVGSQYPVRLSTKVPELIELGRAARGQVMEWTFNAVEGNINPKSGKPYINRYFEGVAPIDPDAPQTAPNATPASRTGTGQVREYAPDLKDRMIVRQTALKAAAEIIAPRAGTSIDPDYDPALEVMRAAARFETWVYRDIDPPPSTEAGRPPLSEHDQQIPY